MVFFLLHPIRWTLIALLGLAVSLYLLGVGIEIGDAWLVIVSIILIAVSILFGFHSIKWGIRLVRGFFS